MDKKALRILYNTYWSAKGWKRDEDRTVDPADFAYAREAGIMFQPIRMGHNEVVARASAARDRLTTQAVANAFVASLTTRQLHWRSALGSFAATRNLRRHPFRGVMFCAVCGTFSEEEQPIDRSVLNFERFKWGGVRHEDPTYAMFDLEQFPELGDPVPTPDDIRTLRAVLAVVGKCGSVDRPADLERQLTDVVRSNKVERQILIHILSYCGILRPDGISSYFDEFTPFEHRNRRSLNWSHSVGPWRGRDGIDFEALSYYFGHLVS